ncbi:MAG TPA: sigma factor [Phycisphaerales bacterium]|nr:sigma factor [Phycisphaerales bacterium]
MKIDPKHLAFANIVIRTEVKKLRERGVIRRADAEDIASELMAQLLEVWDRFAPERGSREAFINQVVSTRLLSLLRERRAQKRRGTPRPLDADDDTAIDYSWSGDGWRRQIDLRVDLEVAFTKLTARQRALCEQMLREALTPAAKELGVPRSTLRYVALKVRQIFRDAGLEEYL